MLATTDEVVTALRDLDGSAPSYAAEYAEFRARFHAGQDGHAADRAVAAFFGSAERRIRRDPRSSATAYGSRAGPATEVLRSAPVDGVRGRTGRSRAAGVGDRGVLLTAPP